MSKKLDGRIVAESLKKDLIQRSQAIKSDKILTVYIGDNEASDIYLKQQIKAADDIGIEIHVIYTPVLNYNNLNITNPFIIQQPMKLADGITKQSLSNWLNRYQKYDVDGICSNNIAAISMGSNPTFYPCTPSATIELLNQNQIRIDGKHIVVIGRSNTVGRPLAQMLENLNATVTMCHSSTAPSDLSNLCEQADIIISATGQKDTLSYPNIKPKSNQIYVDIGGKDINPNVYEYCWGYCCSPGGVGPITAMKLMDNVLKFYERSK